MATLMCQKCGRSLSELEFFKTKKGSRFPLCKTCLTMYIDNNDPETFKWILEKFDVPYIEENWKNLANKIYKRDPYNFSGKSVIGTYIRSMNMHQYCHYTYADSDRINEEKRQKKAAELARQQEIYTHTQEEYAELQKKYEDGEITLAEFQTMTQAPEIIEPNPEELIVPPPLVKEEEETIIKEEEPIVDTRIIELEQNKEFNIEQQLSQDDFMYLATKWGASYKPSEWVQMEQLYKEYESEYELNIDRREALKQICKITLKLNDAIDVGDTSSAKSYSSILDQFRKSAKFTEAQKKDETNLAGSLDSIGELIAVCEEEGGIIAKYHIDPDEYPQDKIDFTLKDLKNYNRNLIVNELGLGDLIESYIAKMESVENAQDAGLNDFALSIDDDLAQSVTDEESADFEEWLEEEVQKDAENLLQEFGEE